MTVLKWRDEDLDRHLRNLSVEAAVSGAPQVSASLLARTRARLQRSRFTGRVRFVSAAAAVLLALCTIPATMAAMGKPILGIQVSISNMDVAKWIRQGFSDWKASPGTPEFLSPVETANVAPFPIRVPTWLPEGYEAISEPKGAYAYVHENGQWAKGTDLLEFFVSQGFRFDGDSPQRVLSVMQTVLPAMERGLTMAPGTVTMEIKGHPAFFQSNLPMAKADQENEERARRGELPEIVQYVNQLQIWVEEANGQITEITVLGEFPQEVLVKVAESLFAS